jgi:hypothetical protein
MDVTQKQKESFYQLLDQHLETLNENKQEKFLITQEAYDKIIKTLQQVSGQKSEYGANFKLFK